MQRRLNAGVGVLHDETARGREAQSLCGAQEDLRVRLGAGDLVAVYHGIEPGVQAYSL